MQDQSSGVAMWLRQQHPDLGPFLTTVLLLMAELAAGDASPLAPWLQHLPTSHDCLLAWSTAERQELAGEMASAEGKENREALSSQARKCMCVPRLPAGGS